MRKKQKKAAPAMKRIEVPGGWVYVWGGALVWVPDPDKWIAAVLSPATLERISALGDLADDLQRKAEEKQP